MTIDDILAEAARRHGQEALLDYLKRTAQIESSGNPKAHNPDSGAAGLFQFMPKTWGQYGQGDPTDPAAATEAMLKLTEANKAALTKALGRDPTPAELYLAHQQGAGGATKMLTNPTGDAASTVGEKAIAWNGGKPGMTNADFAKHWLNAFDRKGGGATNPQGAPEPALAFDDIRPAAPAGGMGQPSKAGPSMAVADDEAGGDPFASFNAGMDWSKLRKALGVA